MNNTLNYNILRILYDRTHHKIAVATSLNNDKQVLLKMVACDSPESSLAARCRNEFNVIKRFDSPYIVKALELCYYAGGCALVLEKIEGDTLKALIGKTSALDPRRFLDIAIEITQGLTEIHRHNTVHLDIKPANIMLAGAKGQPVFIDFEFAGQYAALGLDDEAGANSSHFGTLAYMSPEQTGRTNNRIDNRSDLYSLGVTFYEMVTGVLPFAADDAMGLIHHHLASQPKHPSSVNPSIPPIVGDLILKLIAKLPEERYQSATGLLSDLQEIRQSSNSLGSQAAVTTLGRNDVNDRLEVPDRLFGRTTEMQIILDTFEATSKGAMNVLLVTGASGVGKSSLVKALLKPITRDRGYYVKGKFEPLKRDQPYYALIQALEHWTDQIMREDSARIENWRTRIHQTIGANAGCLTELIPNLEGLIGRQKPLPQLGPNETASRLFETIKAFLKLLAQKEHPFVMFIDDWQWADVASIKFLRNLLESRDVGYFMLIGAYRSNEVDETHLVATTLADLLKAGFKPTYVQLAPLKSSDLQDLLAATFRRNLEKDAELGFLATVIERKTQGNPFFVRQMLRHLHRESLITFAAGKGWVWDAKTITSAPIQANVVDVLSSRLNTLDRDCKDNLMLASLVGTNFTIDKLRLLSNADAYAIHKALAVASDEGFVEHNGNHYLFCHDKIKEAAFAFWQADDLASSRFSYGLALYRRSLARAHNNIEAISDDTVKEILDHWNQVVPLVMAAGGDLPEVFLALNIRMAERAKLSIAYETCQWHLTAMKTALASYKGAKAGVYMSTYLLIAHEITALLQKYDESEGHLAAYLAMTTDPVERAKAHKVEVWSLYARYKLQETVAYAINALAELGVKLPRNAKPHHVLLEIAESRFYLNDKGLARLRQAELMVDAQAIKAVEIMSLVSTASFFVNANLFTILFYRGLKLSLKHGVIKDTPFMLMSAGFAAGAILGRFGWSKKIVDTGYAIMERIDMGSEKARARMMIAMQRTYYFHSPSEGVKELTKSLRDALELRDGESTTSSVSLGILFHLLSCRELGAIPMETYAAAAKSFLVSLEVPARGSLASMQLAAALQEPQIRSQMEGAYFDAKEMDARMVNLEVGILHAFRCLSENIYHYLVGNIDRAHESMLLSLKYENILKICANYEVNQLFKGLITAKKYQVAGGKERKDAIKFVAKQLKRLVHLERAAQGPLFRAQALLLKGELVRLQGQDPSKSFLAAAKEAHTQGFVMLEGLAYQLLGDYELAVGHKGRASRHLNTAAGLFEAWGAHAIVANLHRTYEVVFAVDPSLAPATSEGPDSESSRTSTGSQSSSRGSQGSLVSTRFTSAHALDLTSVLKASLSLAQEVMLPSLLSKLMGIVIENAGAQECWIFIKKHDQWQIGAYGRHSAPEESAAKTAEFSGKPIEAAPGVSFKTIDYTIRSQRSVLSDDVPHDDLFTDRKFARRAPEMKSLLCMPVVSKNNVVAVLYLENKALRGAFTKQRTATLSLLGGQIAVSIENAVLYSKMEDEIYFRTKDIHAIFSNVRQGILTFGNGLTVDANYSQYLTEIVDRHDLENTPVLPLLFQGTALSSDLQSQIKSVLEYAFDGDRLQFDLNSHILPATVDNFLGHKIIELDWVPIEDAKGIIVKVMVTLRDVTALRAAEKEARDRNHELAMLGTILAIGQEKFETFYLSATTLLRECADLLIAARDRTYLSRQAVNHIFRHLHTLKGNTRTYGLATIAASLHEAETWYANFQERVGQADGERFAVVAWQERAAALAAVERTISDYNHLYQSKLRPMTALTSIDRREDLLAARNILLAGDQQGALRFISEKLRTPFAKALNALVSSLPGLAASLGKGTPQVVFTGRSYAIESDYLPTMESIFTQILRNAVDHGIGSDKPGLITLEVSQDRADAGVRIRVYDNGHGLDLAAIKKKGQSAGLLADAATDDELARLIFHSGLSTAAQVNEVSGRGVGMDAVKAMVEELGGSVSIEFLGAADPSRRRPFALVVELPPRIGAVTDDSKKQQAA